MPTSPRPIRRTASATAAGQVSSSSPPGEKCTSSGGTGGVTTGGAGASVPTQVSQDRPLRRPSTTCGTTSTDCPAVFSGSKTKLPKAISPAPAGGSSSSETTSVLATRSRNQASASAMLSGLCRATSP